MLNEKFGIKYIATLGFGPYVPAPGTVASLLAIAPLFFLPEGFFDWELLTLIIMTLIIGFYSTRAYLKAHPSHEDPQEVIIDEVAGQWVAALGTGGNPLWILVSFVLFRILDITKPGFIGVIDRMHPRSTTMHSITILADDFLAGGIAAGMIFVTRYGIAAFL